MKFNLNSTLIINTLLAFLFFCYFCFHLNLFLEYSKEYETSFFSAVLIFGSLTGIFLLGRRYYSVYLLPTLTIIALIFIGYILKIQILMYMLSQDSSDDESYVVNSYKLEIPILQDINIINEYQLIIAILMVVSLLVLFFQCLLFENNRNLNSVNKYGHINFRKVNSSIDLSIILSCIIFAIVLNTGIGFTSGDPDLVVKLPFRMAGLIQAVLNFIIPSFLVAMMYYSFKSRNDFLIKKSSLVLFIFSVLAALITTSKSYLYIGFFSILLMYCYYSGFTRKLLIISFSAVPLIILLSLVASIFRVVRVLEPSLAFYELPYAAAQYWIYVSDVSNGNKFQFSNLGFILRINGADSLLVVLDWMRSGGQIDFSFFEYISDDRIPSINQVFAENVLGLPPTAGLAFSPSLIGYFLILTGSFAALPFCLILYILIWNITFLILAKIIYKDIFMLLTPLLSSAAFFTSEGTLESLHRSIAGLVLITFCVIKMSNFYKIKN